MASTIFTHSDYTVGWVCALPKEQTASIAMLDCEHLTLSGRDHDKNAYTLGAVGEHNVVIACFPKGMYGTISAATVATRMLNTLPSIKFGLLVGIGGGIPPHVRLGDVVVSSPTKQYPGVVQWDFGESVEGGNFKKIGALNHPPSELLTALTKVESRREMIGSKIPDYLDELATKYPKLKTKYIKSDSLKDPQFLQKGVRDDRVGWLALLFTLWQTIVSLVKLLSGWQTFTSRSPVDVASQEQPRDMQVHYGLIASGNRLIKDSGLRNDINNQMDGQVLCVEMEAAGLANDFPCLVIRGICDYADSEKNDDWQEHAATVAAAFAKELLSEVQAREVSQMRDAKIIREVKARVDEISQNVTHIHSALRNKQYIEILEWITAIDYHSVHNDTLKARQHGTCQWFLDSEKYQAWLEASKQTMFCQGIPGAGKTILTSVVVHDIIQRFHEDSNIGIAYICCNYRKQDDQTIDIILASLVKQFAEQQAAFPKVIQDLYELHNPKKTRPLAEELSETLRLLVETHDRVFILFDALDECLTSGGSRSELFQLLTCLKKNSHVNLFMTSRYMSDMKEEFQSNIEEELEGNIVKMEIRASKEDVGSYLDSRLASLSDLVRKNKDLRDEIRTKVIEAVDGMFLLAELHARSLEGMFLPNQIRQALETLPTGTTAYDETYRGAMNRIESRGNTKEFAKKILAWITCVRRPLKTSELRRALAVQVDDTDLDESNLPEIGDVIAACAGLVVVDKESNIIRLAHYTTQEYFERTQVDWFPNAETDITNACVTYLLYKTFQPENLKTWHIAFMTLQKHELFDYAATNWGHHVRMSQTASKEVIGYLQSDRSVKTASHYLLARAENLSFNIEHLAGTASRIYGNDDPHSICKRSAKGWGIGALHLAAYFGMAEVIEALSTYSRDVDVMGYLDRTPLAWAAKNGHTATVKLLLKRGAYPDSSDCYRQTPLYMAVKNGHQPVVELLLETKRVNGDLADRNGRTLLSLAAEKGHGSIASLLLRKGGANADSRDWDGDSPLFYAARSGHLAIFDRLLSTGMVDMTAAARSGNIGIVQRLLQERKIDVNSQSPNGETMIFQAVEKGHGDVVKLLLTKDETQVDLRDKYGRTPLFRAAELGLQGILKLLIDSGKADMNARDKNNDTPLTICVRQWIPYGSVGALTVLLKSDQVQVDVKGFHGETAIEVAISNKSEESVRLLSAAGRSGLRIQDSEGYTPLTKAVVMKLESIVRVLLEVGHADVNAKDSHGRTPLQWAASLWNRPIVWLLLQNGAEFEGSINDSIKPLSEFSREDVTIVMRAAIGWK